jgi:uncharacterized protein YndB with AHSA1/START domain
MSQKSVTHSTFVIERNFPASPERIFAALADPAKKRRWYAEGSAGHDIEEFEMAFEVGGIERARYRFNERSPFPGTALVADGTILDIVPGHRVVIASNMTVGDRRISASLVTFEILASGAGTDFVLTHQGAFFEGADGPVMREAGWQKLLDRLATELTRQA